jgi:hypothetical protein
MNTFSSSPSTLSMLGLGTEIAALIIVPLLLALFIGTKLDRVFDTLPVFTLGLLPVSFTISCSALYRKIKQLNKKPN